MERMDASVGGGARAPWPAAAGDDEDEDGVGRDEEDFRAVLAELERALPEDDATDPAPPPGADVVADIDALKAGFESGELALDGYLERLVAARHLTGPGPAMPPPVPAVAGPAVTMDGHTPPVVVEPPRAGLPPRAELLAAALGIATVGAALAMALAAAWRSGVPPPAVVAEAPGIAGVTATAEPPAPPPLAAPPAVPVAIPRVAPPQSRPAATPTRSSAAAPPSIGFARGERIVVPESRRFVQIPVAVRGRLREPVRLAVRATPGAATEGADYVPPVATLDLPRGSTGATVLVSLLADSRAEHVEDFSVELAVAGGRAELGRDSIIVVVTDDD